MRAIDWKSRSVPNQPQEQRFEMSGEEIDYDVVEDFLDRCEWGPGMSDHLISVVADNLSGFWSWLHSSEMEGCQKAVDESLEAKWRHSTCIRGVQVFVCADSFSMDHEVGMPWGPEDVWAIRRDDATEFILTNEEADKYSALASEQCDPYDDIDC